MILRKIKIDKIKSTYEAYTLYSSTIDFECRIDIPRLVKLLMPNKWTGWFTDRLTVSAASKKITKSVFHTKMFYPFISL